MFSFSASQSSRSSGPIPARIIDPRATPYYWYHQCLNDSKVYTLLEEDITPSDVQTHSAGASSSSTSSFSSLSTPSPRSPQRATGDNNNNNNKIPSQCARCGYVLRYDTILTNESYQPVETLAGKNLLANRFVQFLVRCGYCGQTNKNYLPAHSMYNNQASGLTFLGDEQCNNCWHYHLIRGRDFLQISTDDSNTLPSAAMTCKSCTIVNPFGEDFMMFLSRGALLGGPLHRHLVAAKMELEIQSMQVHQHQGIQVQRKRKSESVGAQSGKRGRSEDLADLKKAYSSDETGPGRRGMSGDSLAG